MRDPADLDRWLRMHAEQSSEYANLLIDRDGTIVWCNDTAARVFGYAREALVSRLAGKLTRSGVDTQGERFSRFVSPRSR